MNCITKFIKPKIKSLFEKRSSKTETNLWTTCSCKNLIYSEEMNSNRKVCPKCGEHHKLTCKERFETFFDNKEFLIIETPLPKDDPLNFEDKKKYTDRLSAARKLTGQDDAILIAKGKIKNIDVVVGAQDFRFIGGSFGAASGEAFIAGAQNAIENNFPYIFFSCSGGQRMHESSIALMQMSRTALAVNELKKKNIPLFPWSSQARGFFLKDTSEKESYHPADPNLDEQKRVWHSKENLMKRDRCFAMAREKGFEPIEIALAYVLNQDFPVFPLIGPRNFIETESSVNSLKVQLTKEEMQWLDLN